VRGEKIRHASVGMSSCSSARLCDIEQTDEQELVPTEAAPGVTKGLQERSIDTKLVGSFRMGARAVDWARLESVCTARYRGFESLPIRHIFGLLAGRPKAEHPANTVLIG
jgi:hypothetical protein